MPFGPGFRSGVVHASLADYVIFDTMYLVFLLELVLIGICLNTRV